MRNSLTLFLHGLSSTNLQHTSHCLYVCVVAAYTQSQLQTQAEQVVQQSADAAAADRVHNIITSISPHVSLQPDDDHARMHAPQLLSPTTTATQVQL